jgi:hypothetical protein
MAARIKFKQSASMDVVANVIYVKPHDPATAITKGNAENSVKLEPAPTPEPDGFIHLDIKLLFPNLDGDYDFGISAIDDAGNISPLLTQGLVNVSLDFVAPSPPTDASVYYV